MTDPNEEFLRVWRSRPPSPKIKALRSKAKEQADFDKAVGIPSSTARWHLKTTDGEGGFLRTDYDLEWDAMVRKALAETRKGRRCYWTKSTGPGWEWKWMSLEWLERQAGG